MINYLFFIIILSICTPNIHSMGEEPEPPLESKELIHTRALQMEHSLVAQFRDLRLVNDIFMTFDITGLRGVLWKIEQSGLKTCGHIPFFKVKKDAKFFYILGTCHALPTAVLPEFVCTTISNCRILAGERDVPECVHEEPGDRQKELRQWLESLFDPTETWFNDLTDREQKYLQALFSQCYPSLSHPDAEIREALEELNINNPIPRLKIHQINSFIYLAHIAASMDLEIQEYFQENGHRIQNLELEEETKVRSFQPPTFEENWAQVTTTLQEALEGKGTLFNTKLFNTVIRSYMLGSEPHVSSDDGEFEMKEVFQDNIRWYPRIIKMATEAPSGEMLVAIGEDHLKEKDGILYRLLTEGGYTANRYHPLQTWVPVNPADLLV